MVSKVTQSGSEITWVMLVYRRQSLLFRLRCATNTESMVDCAVACPCACLYPQTVRSHRHEGQKSDSQGSLFHISSVLYLLKL